MIYHAKRTDKEIITVPADGHCYVHNKFTKEDVIAKKAEYPNAEVICHPECVDEVQEACDKILSTGGMLTYISQSDKEEFIIGTEIDMITEIYAHILDEDRKVNAQKFESMFYANPDLRNVTPPPESSSPVLDLASLVDQLKQSPELAQTLSTLLAGQKT